MKKYKLEFDVNLNIQLIAKAKYQDDAENLAGNKIEDLVDEFLDTIKTNYPNIEILVFQRTEATLADEEHE